jgi:hypothetical protein
MLANLERLVQPFLANGGGTFPSPYDAYRIETEIEKTGVAFYFSAAMRAFPLAVAPGLLAMLTSIGSKSKKSIMI